MSNLQSLSDLMRQVKRKNDVSSKALRQCQKDLEKSMEKFQKKIKNGDEAKLQGQIPQWIQQNNQQLQAMEDYSEEESDDFFINILVIMMVAIWIAFDKKTPRYTQLISFWFNTHSNKTILEIKTGEGKTMIVAMTALYYALRGKKVDVFTSSSALATTETRADSSVRKFFELFNITLGNNCQIGESRAKVYENQVIYGTSFDFQGDYLRKIFCGDMAFFKGRNFDENHVAILDEVDALLIDRMTDSTRISSRKPLFDAIKAIFILIHEIKFQLIKAKKRFCGQLKVKILGKEIEFNRNVNEDLDEMQAQDYVKRQKAQILDIVRAALKTDIGNLIPNYLKKQDGYVQIMLESWIDSCYEIYDFQELVNFVVNKQTNQIIPIDISTGTYQKNTKWMNGVHQFLELQYGFEPSVDSIVTNYESNLIYFQRYRHYLFGLTGTIARSCNNTKTKGNQIFENFLKQTYEVDIYKIPTAKERLLKIENPKMYANHEDHFNGLYKESMEISQKRVVLIIFETIKQAKLFIEKFPQNHIVKKAKKDNENQQNTGQTTQQSEKSEKSKKSQIKAKKDKNQKCYFLVQLYDNDNYHNSLSQPLDNQRTIIVSTNLGGRGTDIEIKNQRILKHGGLHVMMTYFARNWRIEEQAFGRAGRNGQPGSGAFYMSLAKYLDEQSFSKQSLQQLLESRRQCQKFLDRLEQQRTEHEITRFQQAQRTIENEMIKKELLDKFHETYLKETHEKLIQFQNKHAQNKMTAQDFLEQCMLIMQMQCVEQQWGIFLKRKIKDSNDEKIQVDFDEFVQQYQLNRQNNDVNPGFYAQCGIKLIQICPKEAEQLFDKALQKNSNSWVNLYYKLYFILKSFEVRQNKVLKPEQVQELDRKLAQLCNFLLIDFSLESVILSHGQDLTQQKKNQLESMKTFYIEEMSNLHSIATELRKQGIQNEQQISIQCRLFDRGQKSEIIGMKGFGKSIEVSIQRADEFAEEGFFERTFNGLGNLVAAAGMGIFSAVATVTAVVATPFVALFGQTGSVGNMWQGVGGMWKEAGSQLVKSIRRLSPAMTVGFGIMSVLAASGILTGPAMIAMIAWMYFDNSSAVKGGAIQIKQFQHSIYKLVEITGQTELSKQYEEKVSKLRQNIEMKKAQYKQQFINISKEIKKMSKKENRNAKNIRELEEKVFRKKEQKIQKKESKRRTRKETKKQKQQEQVKEQVKEQILEEVQEEIQQKISQKTRKTTLKKNTKMDQKEEQKVEQNIVKSNYEAEITNIMAPICHKIKMAKVATQQLQKLNETKSNAVNETQKVIESFNQDINEEMVNNVNKQAEQLNKIQMPVQRKKQVTAIMQQRVHQDQSLIKEFKQKATNYFNEESKKNSKQQSIKSIKQVVHIPEKMSFLNPQVLEKEAELIEQKVHEIVKAQQAQKQIKYILTQKTILKDPLSLDTDKILNSSMKKVVENAQENYLTALESKAEHDTQKKIKNLDHECVTETTELMKQVIGKKSDKLKKMQTTPLKDPKMINEPLYYGPVIQHQCKMQDVKFIEAKDIQKIKDSELEGSQQTKTVLLVNQIILIFRFGKMLVSKIYAIDDEKLREQKEQLKRLEIKKIIIAEKQSVKFIGSAMINDVKQFITADQRWELTEQCHKLSQEQIKSEYIEGLLLKGTAVMLAEAKHQKIVKQRKNQQSPLPEEFLPFEYKVKSKQFQEFQLSLMDYLCQNIFKNQAEFQKHRYLVSSQTQKLIALQIEIILEKYESMKDCVKKTRGR